MRHLRDVIDTVGPSHHVCYNDSLVLDPCKRTPIPSQNVKSDLRTVDHDILSEDWESHSLLFPLQIVAELRVQVDSKKRKAPTRWSR